MRPLPVRRAAAAAHTRAGGSTIQANEDQHAMSLYPPPETVQTELWTRMPDEFRRRGDIPHWVAANRPGHTLDSFLEGPSFDRDGNLYVTDIPYGRVFRIDPNATWTLVAEYDGWPNGLKIHRDGCIYITDYRRGIVLLDPARGTVEAVLTHRKSESFRGVNDLFFDARGRMYFTDQGQTGLHDPTGRVYRFDLASERLDCIIANAPSPNGLVMNPDETILYVAMTRGNAVWRVPIFPDDATSKVSIFTAMAGGNGGADGMAMDSEGTLHVCDAGNACVWSFSRFGEPRHRYCSPTAGRATTNCAFGGHDNRELFITESETGSILRVTTPAPGQPMFAHA
jgi:gluconolactonase